jgi:hypothetical protein
MWGKDEALCGMIVLGDAVTYREIDIDRISQSEYSSDTACAIIADDVLFTEV